MKPHIWFSRGKWRVATCSPIRRNWAYTYGIVYNSKSVDKALNAWRRNNETPT